MRKLLLLFFALSISASAQVWTKVCDSTTATCPTTGSPQVWPGARAFMWRLPYDPVNHESLYFGGMQSDASIYEDSIWGYNTTTHAFTRRAYNGNTLDTGTGCAAYPATGTTGNTAAQSYNPQLGHPLGFMAVDTTHGYWYLGTTLCDNFYNGVTSRYNINTRTMDSLVLSFAWPSTSCAMNSHWGCSAPSFGTGMEFVSGYGKTIICCQNASSSGLLISEFDGSTYTDVTSSQSGTVPSYLLNGAGMFSDGTYLFVFGGCLGTSPGNAASGVDACNGTFSNDTYRYAPSTKVWTKLTISGGIGPNANNQNFPMVAWDSTRSRVLVYDPWDLKLWSGVINNGSNTITWSQVTFSGTNPDFNTIFIGTTDINKTGTGDMASYDPSTDTFVVIFARSQDAAPGVYELALGGSVTLTSLTVSEAGWPNNWPQNGTADATMTSSTPVARTNEPLTFGLPLADSAAITSPSTQLGISGGPTVAQFSCLANWPSGNCSRLLIDTQIPSLSAGGAASITLTTGSGNTGSNLATDNTDCAGSHTGYIKVDTGTGGACFAIRKANFNGFDQVVVNGTTLVATNTSDGLILQGPAADGSSTTCGSAPLSGCTTVYKSSNDGSSNCSIEEAGPVRTAIECHGGLKNGTEAYINFQVRMHFYKGSAKPKIEIAWKNANETSTAGDFTSATKGLRSIEFRLKLAGTSGSLTSILATDTGTSTHTFSGTEDSFLFQGFSSLFEGEEWSNLSNSIIDIARSGSPPYTFALDGFRVVGGTSGSYATAYTADRHHISKMWGDIADSSGKGVTVGGYAWSAYWPKSIQFMAGGSDIRIGLKPDQSLWVSPTGNTKPYWIPWPQYWRDTIYLNFHTAAPSSPGNEMAKMQQFLVARAPIAYYNSTGIFRDILEDPTEYASYMTSVAASLAVSAGYSPFSVTWNDPTDFSPAIWRYYGGGTGPGSESDFGYDGLLRYLTRGHTGAFLWGYNRARYASESLFARADGFTWAAHTPKSDLTGQCQPASLMASSQNVANAISGEQTWLDGDHIHFEGTPEFYYFTGDRFIKDYIDQAFGDRWTNPGDSTSCGIHSIVTGTAQYIGDQRNTAIELGHTAVMRKWAVDTGNNTIKTNAETVFDNILSLAVVPDLSISGTGTSATLCDPGTGTRNSPCYGTSRTRGFFEPAVWGTYTDFDYSGSNGLQCTGLGATLYPHARLSQPLEISLMVDALDMMMWQRTSSWTYYNTTKDLITGMSLWAFNEAYYDDGTVPNSGYRHSVPGDFACLGPVTSVGTTPNSIVCECQSSYGREATVWHLPRIYLKYTGDRGYESVFKRSLHKLLLSGTSQASPTQGPPVDDWGVYSLGDAIYRYLHPPAASLQTVSFTSFSESPSGTYNFSWNLPSGTSAQYLKYDSGGKQIVDWLYYNASSGAFTVSPSTHSTWFGSAYTSSQPTSSASSISISGLPTGLPQNAFMLKAMSTGTSGGGPTNVGGSVIFGNVKIGGKSVVH